MPTGPKWLAARYGVEPAELARRVFRDLNEAAKTVDAARALAAYLIKVVEQQNAAPHPHLTTNGFRITFGAVVLTLRRFEDDWSRYIVHLLPKDQRPVEAASLLRTSRTTNSGTRRISWWRTQRQITRPRCPLPSVCK